jgi:hypothetical protein
MRLTLARGGSRAVSGMSASLDERLLVTATGTFASGTSRRLPIQLSAHEVQQV